MENSLSAADIAAVTRNNGYNAITTVLAGVAIGYGLFFCLPCLAIMVGALAEAVAA